MNTRTLTRLAVRNAVKDEVLVLPKAHTVLLDALVERSQTIESDYLRESPALLSWIDFEQVRKL
jgi:predicted metal-dependent enzyme (double-stranded beta helix superfamily)